MPLNLNEFNIPTQDEWELETKRILKSDNLNKLFINNIYEDIELFSLQNKNNSDKILVISDSLFSTTQLLNNFPNIFDNYQSLVVDYNTDIVYDKLNFKNNTDYFINLTNLLNNGSSASLELGISMFLFNEILKKIADLKENSNVNFVFHSSIGNNFLFEISKYRIFKYLLYKLVSQNQISSKVNIQIVATPSTVNKSTLDVENNIVRMTLESISACLGGADYLNLNHFDLGMKAESFAERISHNIFNIINDESHLNEYRDALNSSFVIESISYKLAENAFNKFKEITKLSKNSNFNLNDYVKNNIEKTKIIHINKLNTISDILIGVNKFPNMKENIEDISKYKSSSIITNNFEQFINKSLDYKQVSGKLPSAYFLKFGDKTEWFSILEYAKEFISLGKITIDEMEQPIETIEDTLNLLYLKTFDIVVLCTVMDKFNSIIPDLASGFKQSNPDKILIVMGNPKEDLERYSKCGVDYFIHSGVDFVDKLNSIHKMIVDNHLNKN